MTNWAFWLEVFVRSATLLLAAGVVYRAAKSQNAAFRHRLLLCTLILLALLPVLTVLLPEIQVQLHSPHRTGRALVTAQELSATVVRIPARRSVNWPVAIWIAGVCAACLPMAIGAFAAWKMVRDAKPVATPTIKDAVNAVGALLPSKTQVLFCNRVSVPLTCGIFVRKILLPRDAEAWSPSRLKAVLLHETAHVRRRDVAVQTFARIIAALYWFQPFVWELRRRLRRESELACDDDVLRAGFVPSEYAAELLAIATTISRGQSFPAVAIGMARCCDFENRLRAIVNPPVTLFPRMSRSIRYALASSLALAAITASAVNLSSRQTLNPKGGSTMKSVLISALLTSTGLTAATI
ncbi:MAG: M56 family metallopeptidase, partial [Acidobacteriaceae bacterium]|nr:M56 family metallopeptidase [Acidobacteriaceae bacterium]